MKKLITFLAFFSLSYSYPLSNIGSSFDDNLRATFLKTLQNSKNEIYSFNNYSLKYGWNTLTTPKDGVDVEKTFNNSAIEYVVVYDNVSKKWAVYSPKNKVDKEFLKLIYLEPNITFFVLTNKNVKIEIKSTVVDGKCRDILDKNSYISLLDSGINQDKTISKDGSISIRSRYFSNHEKGIYNDTRVLLIYPKLVDIKTKRKFRYGPAIPKIALEFAKEYENRMFYVYNFRQKQCYRARFPSIKIPPFPVLEKY